MQFGAGAQYLTQVSKRSSVSSSIGSEYSYSDKRCVYALRLRVCLFVFTAAFFLSVMMAQLKSLSRNYRGKCLVTCFNCVCKWTALGQLIFVL